MSIESKIESNIPLPQTGEAGGRISKYALVPFNDMRIGDSVLLEIYGGDRKDEKKLKYRISTISTGVKGFIFRNRLKGTFKVAYVFNKENQIEIRLWRI